MDQLSFDVPSAVLRDCTSAADEPALAASQAFATERRTQRAPCNSPVQLDATERSVIGVCSNISLGGMFVLGPALPIGDAVRVTMELPSLGRVRIAGEVLAHRHHPNGSGMAIRFARLAQSDLASITRFVAERVGPTK